jgi:hypothetical protein
MQKRKHQQEMHCCHIETLLPLMLPLLLPSAAAAHFAALQRATISSKALRLLANRKLVNTSSRAAPGQESSQRTTCEHATPARSLSAAAAG